MASRGKIQPNSLSTDFCQIHTITSVLPVLSEFGLIPLSEFSLIPYVENSALPILREFGTKFTKYGMSKIPFALKW